MVHCLVIEDAPNTRELIFKDLKTAGFTYEYTEKIDHAKDLLKNNIYQAIFLDMNLGSGNNDGLLIIEWMNSNNINCPVIISSAIAYNSREILKERLEKPFIHLRIPPMDLHDNFDIIGNYIRKISDRPQVPHSKGKTNYDKYDILRIIVIIFIPILMSIVFFVPANTIGKISQYREQLYLLGTFIMAIIAVFKAPKDVNYILSFLKIFEKDKK